MGAGCCQALGNCGPLRPNAQAHDSLQGGSLLGHAKGAFQQEHAMGQPHRFSSHLQDNKCATCARGGQRARSTIEEGKIGTTKRLPNKLKQPAVTDTVARARGHDAWIRKHRNTLHLQAS